MVLLIRSTVSKAREGSASKAPDLALAAACAAAIAASSVFTWILNQSVFPITSEALPWARELQTGVPIVLALVLLAATHRRPSLVRPGFFALIEVACILAGSATLLLAPLNPAAVGFGLMVSALGRAWNSYLVCFGLSSLGIGRPTSLTVIAGVAFGTMATTLCPVPPYAVGVAVGAMLALVPLGLLFGRTRGFLEELRKGPTVTELAAANPWSFLGPFHQVYVLMAIFSVASGFSHSLNIAGYTPVSDLSGSVVLAVVLVWFGYACKRPERSDTLFAVCMLLVCAGFLLAPLNEPAIGALPNGLLQAGRTCFSVLSWTVLAALCARNPSGAIAVVACGGFASGVGTFIGADTGHLVNMVAPAGSTTMSLVADGAVLLLMAYVLLGLKGFSFAATIEGVVPAAYVQAPEVIAPSRDELMDRACAVLARDCGLTEREREVMGLLARGRNSSYVQEALVLSYNTVKTHVKRIYRKLDVHSQQDLIDLVEMTMEGDGREVTPSGGGLPGC